MEPAHKTKDLKILHCPLSLALFQLHQLDDGQLNGTALWLGAQCLAQYLIFNHSKYKQGHVLELGSGIGLTALVLRALGWDVVATDQKSIIDSVLERNIAINLPNLPPHTTGSITVRELDWNVPPELWLWDHDTVIASTATTTTSGRLARPFDLIVTADTVYSRELITPLLRTLHGICTASADVSEQKRSPPILICIERRDHNVVEDMFASARSDWGFKVQRIPQNKLTKALAQDNWSKADWDGVELWKFTLLRV